MKVIFLDIDGVLNTTKTNGKLGREILLPWRDNVMMKMGLTALDPDPIAQLNRVVKETGAKIVISSNWRNTFRYNHQFPVLIDYLKYCGVEGDIIGRTPIWEEYRGNLKDIRSVSDVDLVVGAISRGKEIQIYLDQHPDVTKFVIVDDNTDMEHLKCKLVNTQFETGITQRDADEMIVYLRD